MLPKLRVMLAALLATTLVALAASAGLLGAGDKHVADVPEVSRPLVQRAIVATPDPQHLQTLAYSRRADELQRLRELSASPARAVVEYAEQAQKAAADAPPPAETAAASVPGSPASEPTVANAPAEPPATTGSSQASAPPPPAPQADGGGAVAAIEPGTAATEAASDEHKPAVKPRHGLRARKHSKTVKLVPAQRRILPQAATGFPIDLTPVQPTARAAQAPAQARQAQTLTTDAAKTQPEDSRASDALTDARINSGR